MAIEIPLRLKYRVKSPSGFKSRSSNGQGTKSEKKQGDAHRRVNYGPFWWIDINSQRPIEVNP